MDPNATLEMVRRFAVEILEGDKDLDRIGSLALSLAEAFKDLDDWLSKGGFPPRGWFDAK